MQAKRGAKKKKKYRLGMLMLPLPPDVNARILGWVWIDIIAQVISAFNHTSSTQAAEIVWGNPNNRLHVKLSLLHRFAMLMASM